MHKQSHFTNATVAALMVVALTGCTTTSQDRPLEPSQQGRQGSADGQTQAQRNYQGTSTSGEGTGSEGLQQRLAKTRQVSGQVVKVKEVRDYTSGDRATVAMIKTNKNNQRLIVDLGPSSRMSAVKVGSQIMARGQVVPAGNQPIMVAEEAKIDGQTLAISRQQRSSHRGSALSSRERRSQGASQGRSTIGTTSSGQGAPSEVAPEPAPDVGIFIVPAGSINNQGAIDKIITEEDEIKEDADRYIGKRVILRGEVEEKLGEHVFSVDYDGAIGMSKIVVLAPPRVLKSVPADGTAIRLHGEIQRFDQQTAEQRYKLAFTRELADQLRGQPVVVADGVF